MAISYNDYKNKYKKQLEEAEKYHFAQKEQDRINNMSSKDAKAEYKNKAYEKQSTIKDFRNIYKQNDIAINDSSLNPTATPTTYQNKTIGVDYNKEISLNPSEGLIEKQKKSLENYNKFNEFNEKNKNLVNEKKQNVIQKYNETAQAFSNYQQKKLDEDNIGIYDKTLGRLIGGMTSPFTQFAGEQAINENGDLYYLPSYNDLKQQKVLDSYGNSFIDKVAKVGTSALYEGGKIVTSAVLNKIAPGLGTTTYFSDIYTKQLNQAVSEGYSDGRSLAYASLSTATEFATEKLLGGTTKFIFGKGASSELSKNISAALSKTFTKNPRLVNAVANGISEGGEEFLQEFIDVFSRNITLGEKENPFTMETLENAIYSGAVGALTGVFSGATDSNDYFKLKKQRQEYADNVAKLPTSNDFGKDIINDGKNTKIDLENKLPSVNYNTGTDIDSKLNKINLPLKEDLNTTINNRINLPINEMTNTQNENYQYNVTSNQKINNLRESASKYFDNSQDIQNLVNVAEKLVNDKNYNITFDNNIKDTKGNIVDGVIEKLDNGEVSIKINPNSKRAGEFLLVHEITHAIETPELRNFITDYARKNPVFAESVKALETMYEASEVTGETVADISANLFGNQEFINSLRMDNSVQAKTIIQKIYEVIKTFLNNFTAEGRERNFVKKLEEMWREAYITQTNNIVAPIYAKNIQNDSQVKNRNIIQNFFRKKDKTKSSVIPQNFNPSSQLTREIENKTRANMQKYDNVKFVNIDDILSLVNNGGHRTQEQVDALIENIRKNGITQPIEIVKNSDGTFEIGNGNHRLLIAKMFNLKAVPVEYSNSILQNIENNLDLSYNKDVERVYDNDNFRKTNSENVQTGAIETNSNSSNEYVKNRRTATRNDELYNKERGHNNRPSNNTTFSENTLQGQELDNSSFSIEQDIDKYLMPEIYDRYKNEDKTKISETIEELKAYKETLNPDENDEDWNKNFLANQKIKALENGFDNVYDNLVNQDRERLLKDYKSVPEKIESQINKIKSKEIKIQELKDDYKNSTSKQQAQFDIIQKTNPAPEESNYVWIRKPSDIKTFEEIINDKESFTWGDYSKEDALRDLKKGTVTIYSSYAIKNGTFVSTSYQQALDYAGGDPTKVHHRTVALDSVAWINGDEGQYAKTPTKYSQYNSKWQEHLDKYYKPTGTRTDMSKHLIPLREDVNKSANIPLVKKNDTIKVRAEKIAKSINGEKSIDIPIGKELRSWSETSTESDILKDFVSIKDLDMDKITYTQISNKKTLENAKAKATSMSYEEGINYINAKMNDSKVDLTDLAVIDQLLMEAKKRGDMKNATDLIMNKTILGTELGQMVQQYSMIGRMTPEGQLLMFQKIVNRAKATGDKSFEGVTITPEMVETILNTYKSDGTYTQEDLDANVEKFKSQIAEQMKSTTADKINGWRYLSMLGNPKTHIRNIVSNVAMKFALKVKNVQARALETLFIKDSKDRTRTFKKASQDVVDFVDKTTTEMKSIIQGEGKYSIKNQLQMEKATFNNKTLEKISKFNSDALSWEDWLFSKSAFQSSLKEYLTAKGITTKEQINNNSELIEQAKLYAVEQAEIATFRQYSKVASYIQKIENTNTASKLAIGAAIPFKKTPINVAKAGVKYSPIGLIKNLSYDVVQLKNGNINASQFIDNLSQGLTGTSLALMGYALAKAGFITGGDDDDKESKYDSQLGNQDYALKIGNNTYSLSWLSPVAIPFLTGANAYKELEEQEEWDANIVIDTLAKTLDPVSEMSFISGLTDVLSSYQQGSMQMVSNMAQNVTSNYALQFFPTLFSQIASTFDDRVRSTAVDRDSSFKFANKLVKQMMYKIPGLRNTLPVATDIWGEEKKQPDSILERAFNNFIAPYSKKEIKTTSLDNELKRVHKETGDTSVVPGVPQGYVKYKNENYNMNSNEYTSYKKTYGQTANKCLNNLVSNSTYKNADDETKAKMIKEIYGYSKALANEKFFNGRDINYSSNDLTEINKLKDLKMSDTQVAEYVALNSESFSIKNSKDLSTEEKHKKICDNLIKADLEDNQLAYLYSKYYSSDDTLNDIVTLKIPMKQYIKFDSQNFEGKYNVNTGKTISGSRKNEVINYVNSLNLTISQKAILIKSKYSSYDNYNNQIINYVNNLNKSANDKKILLKSIGFDNYNKDIVNYINSQNITKSEKEKKLKKLGFTIRDGRVYW
mgnify:CR=1 FL=1